MSDSFNYEIALEKRESLQAEIDNAYAYIEGIQDHYNTINEEIEEYEQEQAVLDQ